MRLATILTLLGASTLAHGKGKKAPEPTTFNGIEVPPLLELTPDNYDQELKDSTYVMVKHHR
jgi:protein disulfide-isomerase